MKHNPNESSWNELFDELQVFLRWSISSLIDGSFLVFWVFIQWKVSNLLSGFQLENLDKLIFIVFQILFALSTLFPVISYTVVNLVKMAKRSWKAIHKEIKG